jgi:Response regulator containing CheY-like receiver, AAA-type ATPase, and DNA-binding domains
MKKILVIEDEPEMRRNMISLLHYKHYEPIEAENGRVGVETARRETPDLILCDVMMPELDGYGVLRMLQSDEKLAPNPLHVSHRERRKGRPAQWNESWGG